MWCFRTTPLGKKWSELVLATANMGATTNTADRKIKFKHKLLRGDTTVE